jgi:hypothetical protein
MSASRALCFIVLLFAAARPDFASAQAAGQNDATAGCNHLSWSVASEREWFSDPKLARRVSGARLRKIDRAVELALEPTRQTHFFLPPERPPSPDSYSGEVTFFGVPKPGLYQVTVSDDAWIDVFENGARLKRVAQTSAENCRGIRRSARFDLAPGDLVLVELTGAAKNLIKVAFAEAH